MERTKFDYPMEILRNPTAYGDLIKRVWTLVYPEEKQLAPYVAEQVIGIEKELHSFVRQDKIIFHIPGSNPNYRRMVSK